MAKATARSQPEPALKAALLLRVSDARQGGADHFSLDAQRRVLRERCLREGLTPVAEYIGEGESAFTNKIRKRETVQQLLTGAEAGVYVQRGPAQRARLV